jgi:hypothetical protein
MQRLILISALALCISACGQRRNAETPPQAPVSVPEPPANAFYVGQWAHTTDDCPARPWSIHPNAFQAPDGACDFRSIAPVPEGFAVEADCRWGGRQVHASMRFSYAQSAKALLISGTPAGEVGLIACPSANPQNP